MNIPHDYFLNSSENYSEEKATAAHPPINNLYLAVACTAQRCIARESIWNFRIKFDAHYDDCENQVVYENSRYYLQTHQEREHGIHAKVNKSYDPRKSKGDILGFNRIKYQAESGSIIRQRFRNIQMFSIDRLEIPKKLMDMYTSNSTFVYVSIDEFSGFGKVQTDDDEINVSFLLEKTETTRQKYLYSPRNKIIFKPSLLASLNSIQIQLSVPFTEFHESFDTLDVDILYTDSSGRLVVKILGEIPKCFTIGDRMCFDETYIPGIEQELEQKQKPVELLFTEHLSPSIQNITCHPILLSEISTNTPISDGRNFAHLQNISLVYDSIIERFVCTVTFDASKSASGIRHWLATLYVNDTILSTLPDASSQAYEQTFEFDVNYVKNLIQNGDIISVSIKFWYRSLVVSSNIAEVKWKVSGLLEEDDSDVFQVSNNDTSVENMSTLELQTICTLPVNRIYYLSYNEESNLIYIVDAYALYVIDASSKAIGKMDLKPNIFGPSCCVRVRNKIILMPYNSDTLCVIDIALPIAPRITSTFTIEKCIYTSSMYANNTSVVLGSATTASLAFVDCTQDEFYLASSRYNLKYQGLRGMVCNEKYLYAITHLLLVVHISTPSTPVIIGEFLGGNINKPSHICYDGNGSRVFIGAYSADGLSTVSSVDISNPKEPILISMTQIQESIISMSYSLFKDSLFIIQEGSSALSTVIECESMTETDTFLDWTPTLTLCQVESSFLVGFSAETMRVYLLPFDSGGMVNAEANDKVITPAECLYFNYHHLQSNVRHVIEDISGSCLYLKTITKLQNKKLAPALTRHVTGDATVPVISRIVNLDLQMRFIIEIQS